MQDIGMNYMVLAVAGLWCIVLIVQEVVKAFLKSAELTAEVQKEQYAARKHAFAAEEAENRAEAAEAKAVEWTERYEAGKRDHEAARRVVALEAENDELNERAEVALAAYYDLRTAAFRVHTQFVHESNQFNNLIERCDKLVSHKTTPEPEEAPAQDPDTPRVIAKLIDTAEDGGYFLVNVDEKHKTLITDVAGKNLLDDTNYPGVKSICEILELDHDGIALDGLGDEITEADLRKDDDVYEIFYSIRED